MAEMRDIIVKRRIYAITPMLADFDKAHSGMVTQDQFLRVLAMHGLVPREPAGRQAVLDSFRGQASRAHLIDYRRFLEALGAT